MTTPARISRQEIVRHSLDIAREYLEDDLVLTLRQLYYQFVARGLVAPAQSEYKRIGAALTEARYTGEYPVEWLCDRGREVVESDSLLDRTRVGEALLTAEHIVETLPERLLARGRWFGQSYHVSVWVEKAALLGVFEPVAEELGVSLLACRGYPSVSVLHDWLQHAESVDADTSVVLYFGDHDPDGWEIPRSAERNLHRLMETYDLWTPVEFRRVALNMDQIERYNPPPFEAKMSSSRYASYVKEHYTDEAWELDALEPRVLRELIRDNVDNLFDHEFYESSQALVEATRGEFRTRFHQQLVERVQ